MFRHYSELYFASRNHFCCCSDTNRFTFSGYFNAYWTHRAPPMDIPQKTQWKSSHFKYIIASLVEKKKKKMIDYGKLWVLPHLFHIKLNVDFVNIPLRPFTFPVPIQIQLMKKKKLCICSLFQTWIKKLSKTKTGISIFVYFVSKFCSGQQQKI